MAIILGLAGGPEPGGRTSTAIAAVLFGAERQGAQTRLLELSSSPQEEVVAALGAADGAVFGSPTYRSTYSATLKTVLEVIERSPSDQAPAPLLGKAVAVLLTGASAHHFLAVNDLRDVLAGFFAVQVLSPGLYFDHSHYVDRSKLREDSAELAAQHGAALHDLAGAVRASDALRGLRPLI